MNISVKDVGKDIKTIEVEGEIDVYTSMNLKKELNGIIDNGTKKIVVSLKKVVYMDSSGLGVLVAILKKIKLDNGNMKITNLSASIKKIFELTKLTKFFEIYDEEQEAVKSFK